MCFVLGLWHLKSVWPLVYVRGGYAMLLTAKERRLLELLNAKRVRFMLIGASAANAQGATLATWDMDWWFERLDDVRVGDAVREAGGVWVSGNFGMMPPQMVELGDPDRFDVVTHADGLNDFATEFEGALPITIDGVSVRVLPIERILVSKRAANRPKDRATIHALEEAIAVKDDK